MSLNNLLTKEEKTAYIQPRTHTFETPEDTFLKEEKYMIISDSYLESLVEEKVEDKIREILEKRQSFKFRKINNARAREEISEFIKQRHRNNLFKVSILDIVLQLKLPAEQVEKVMEFFVKKDKVKEIT